MRHSLGCLVFTTMALVTCLDGGAMPQASASSERLLLGVVLDSELWRVGGPRPEVARELLAGVLRSGDMNLLDGLLRKLYQWIDRRWLDPTALTQFVPDLDQVSRVQTPLRGQNFAEPLRDQLALFGLPPEARHEIYRAVLETGMPDNRFGLRWEGVCNRALWERMDDLLPLIEEVARTRAPRGEEGKSLIDGTLGQEVALARARRSGDWVRSYMELIRGLAEKERTSRETALDATDRYLASQALVELVQKGHMEVLNDLRVIWRELPVAVDNEQRWKESSQAIAQGRLDPEPPRRGILARDLVRAINGLGDSSFQIKNERAFGQPSAAKAVKELERRKALAPSAHLLKLEPN